MTTATQAILRSVADNDPSLTVGEKSLFQRLILGQADTALSRPVMTDGPLLLTQVEAARILGVSRVTLWRMTKEAVFRPVELTAGNFRYRREEIESVAREGRCANLSKSVGRPRAVGWPRR
jgi:predicted DNA-binding transcriptional regulator AlpA